MKTPEGIDVNTAVGFTSPAIDPFDDVDQQADDYDEATLRERFDVVCESAPWYKA